MKDIETDFSFDFVKADRNNFAIDLKEIRQNVKIKFYYENEKESRPYNDLFIKYIINKLSNIGMANVWREQLTQNKDFSKDIKLINNIKTRLTDIPSQTILSALETNQGKLLFLKQAKITHNLESYLKISKGHCEA